MRRITEIMTRRPAIVGADAPLTEALAVMGDRGISSVLVLRPGSSAYGIVTISAMAEDLPQIVELDCNPLAVHREGVSVLDGRIRVAPVDPPLPLGARVVGAEEDRAGEDPRLEGEP